MFIEHLLCTGTFLGTENTVTDKIIKHSSPLWYSVLVGRAWLVKRKQTPWLSLLNRREQANTHTQSSIKGMCMGGGRSDELSMAHEKVALCGAFSAEGYISEKDGLRLREKWCQEGCNHGNSLVSPITTFSLPTLLLLWSLDFHTKNERAERMFPVHDEACSTCSAALNATGTLSLSSRLPWIVWHMSRQRLHLPTLGWPAARGGIARTDHVFHPVYSPGTALPGLGHCDMGRFLFLRA